MLGAHLETSKYAEDVLGFCVKRSFLYKGLGPPKIFMPSRGPGAHAFVVFRACRSCHLSPPDNAVLVMCTGTGTSATALTTSDEMPVLTQMQNVGRSDDSQAMHPHYMAMD